MSFTIQGFQIIATIFQQLLSFDLGGFTLPGELPSDKESEDTIRRILVSSIFLLILCVLSFWQRIKLERLFFLSYLKGFVQIVLMATVLIILFGLEDLWVLFCVLLFMCAFAAFTTKQRNPEIQNIFKMEMTAITTGSLLVMIFVIAVDIIPQNGTYIIPMGSMVISNAMIITNIVIERLMSDIKKSKGLIEAALSLGDSPSNSIKLVAKESYRAGLLPTTNRVALLGVVTIPGLMAGMIIGGENPMVAAVYQVIIFLMIMVAAFLSIIIIGHLMIKSFFTQEDQLDPNLFG